MRKSALIAGLLWFFLASNSFPQRHTSLKQNDQMPGFTPKEGFVPDSSTAIQIATAVLIPIYGGNKVEGSKPFTAKLSRDRWIVQGTVPKDMVGGAPEVQISKVSGRILRVGSGK